MSSKINDRLLLVLLEDADGYGFYPRLEQLTHVAAKRWRNFVTGAQGATIEMIEAISRVKPQYAFWITTGITDPERGHIAPSGVETFFPIVRGIEQKYATEEFKYLIAQEKLEPIDDDDRKLKRRLIEDEILLMRENDILPKGYLSYERIIRELGETGKAEFFPLELDSELRKIRRLRDEEEDKLRNSIKEWRVSILMNEKILKGIKSVLLLFTKKKENDN